MKNSNLAELVDRLSRLVSASGHSSGLKPAQWQAMRYLTLANRFSRTPGALALWLGSTKGTVSQTVISLEERGLVAKRTAKDRRSVQLELTGAGLAAMEADPLASLRSAIEKMPPSQAEMLSAALAEMILQIIAANGGRAFGHCQDCMHFQKKHAGGSPHFCALLRQPLDEDDSRQICVEQEAA